MTTNESLQRALELGLVTPVQCQDLLSRCQIDNEVCIEAELEALISDQVESGRQCTGDHCSL